MNTTIKPSQLKGAAGGLTVDTNLQDTDTKKAKKPYTPAALTVRHGFGISCFVEAICRTVFHYLAVNGNQLQQATSSRAKVLWLLTYLRQTYQAAKESIAKSPSKKRSEGMKRCLETLTDDMFLKIPDPNDLDRPESKESIEEQHQEEVDKHKLPPLPSAQPEEEKKKAPKAPDEFELKQLKMIFDKCDTSGDGRIRKWELMKACRKHHEIAQFLRLPDKYASAEDHSPGGINHRGSSVHRSQEFSEHFERFFDECQEGGSGDAMEDNELDFKEFMTFYQHIVEADEAANMPIYEEEDNRTPTPLGPAAGKRNWQLRHLCNRGMGNSAPVTLVSLPGYPQPKPQMEDLNSWYGRVNSSCITPPPLNDFSRTIEKRLEDMILDKQRRE
jgi:hypothetical protein